MTADLADDMLLDTSLSTPPLLPTIDATDATGIDAAAAGPLIQPAADAALIPSAHVEDAGQNDVSMPSIHVPDEAALAAAAAAMAAAAQAHMNGSDQQEPTVADGLEGSGDLHSYLLAAAAASVHAQQQRNDNDDDDSQHKAPSEDSFDSTATPVPNSVYTNGTSVNGSEEDDARAAIHDQCRKYTDDRAPYPLSIGKRTPGGFAEALADHDAAQTLDHLPLTEATVELGKTRCYWALLSADHSKGNGPTGEKLNFVYLDPILQQHMAEQAASMVGSDFYDYVHPEERDRVSDDMQKIVESRTLFGSVTRCRYSRIPRIRELLGAVDPPRDPEADRYVEDDSFVAIDIVINWIGDGMLLCFFHAIIDKALEDNDEQHKSDWTNWCGTPTGSFTPRQCDTIWKQVKAVPRETVPDSGPVHVFQVIEAGGDGRVLLSWPPPRLFSRPVESQLVTQSDTTVFHDGSYFADDFARLAQGVSIAPGSSSLSDANTSCTRRFRAKHTLTTEGKVRSIESVLIPYGGVILACFHTTFQQQLPPPDPKLVLQARASLQAAQAERRKAEDEVAQGSPNKRPRTDATAEPSDAAINASEGIANGVASESKTAAAAPLPPTTPKAPVQPSTAANGARPPQPTPPPAAAKPANGATPKPSTPKYSKPIKTESSGLAALANPSLMYTNAPAKPPSTPTPAARPAADRTPAPANGANGHSAAPPSASPSANGGGDSPSGPNKACTGCGKINSPEWRRGPSGHKTLCNACGLRYARSLTRRKKKKGKDGQVEFIEPTGDPSVVPKSRGGGGGSLPGVHRKNSKKRKEEEAAKAAAVAAVAAGPGPAPGAKTPSGAVVGATPAASSTASPSPVPVSGSATQSPSVSTPAAALSSVSSTGAVAAPTPAVKVEATDVPASGAASDTVSAITSVSVPAPTTTATTTAAEPAMPADPSHSMAVSIALDAIAAATSTIPSLDTKTLPLPVSNAISRAIAATIGSTTGSSAPSTADVPASTAADAGAGAGAGAGLVTSQTLDASTAGEGGAGDELDPDVSAAALQTIESVVSEALYKQLVGSTSPAVVAFAGDKTEPATEQAAHSVVDLDHALTADAIRAAAQAAVAHGIANHSEP